MHMLKRSLRIVSAGLVAAMAASVFTALAGNGVVLAAENKDASNTCLGFVESSIPMSIEEKSVLFSTVTKGNMGEDGALYEYTVIDPNINIDIRKDMRHVRFETEVAIPYAVSGNNADNVTQTSILITDKAYDDDAKVLFYETLSGTYAKEGTGTFVLPRTVEGKKWGEDYKVYLIAEDINEGNDYASKPVLLDVPGSTGWFQDGSDWYYIDDNGAKVTGWQKINDSWYYFDDKGVMKTGWNYINYSWYYLDNKGVMVTGWAEVEGKKYYLDSDGKMVTGKKTIDGKEYEFDLSGVLLTKEYSIILKDVKNGDATVSASKAIAGDEITVTVTPVEGYEFELIKVNDQEIKDKKFTMPSKDVELSVVCKKIDYKITVEETENGKTTVNTTTANAGDEITITAKPNDGYYVFDYYVNDEVISVNTFEMPAKDVTVKVIYVNFPYSVMYDYDSDMVVVDSKESTNDVCSFEIKAKDGYEITTVKSGDKELEPDNGLYKLTSPKGRVVVTITAKAKAATKAGWLKEDGNWYYYDSNLKKATGWLKYEDNWYYLNDEGVMQTGWLKTGGKKYYLLSDGKMVTGKQNISGEDYEFDSNGALVTKVYLITLKDVKGGNAEVSAITAKEGDEITITVTPSSGYEFELIKVNGNEIKDKKFKMPADDVELFVQCKKIDYKITVVETENGKVTVNTTTANVGDEIKITATPDADYLISKYVVNGEESDKDTFEMPAKDVEVKVIFAKIPYSVMYDYDSSMVEVDPKEVTDDVCTFEVKAKDGYEIVSVKVDDKDVAVADGLYKLTAPEGKIVVKITAKAKSSSKTGWVQENNTWYYYKDDGSKATGWQKIDEKLYFFDDQGAMKTGWLQDKDTWYYLNASGEMATGWLTIGSNKYYLESDGKMVTGKKTIDGKDYEFGSNGALISGASDTYPVTLVDVKGGNATVSATSAKAGEEITVTVTPVEGYEFKLINVNGTEINDTKFKMPAEEAKLTVVCKKIDYKITVIETENGKTTVNTTNANAGDEITITATPDDGYYAAEYLVNGEKVEGEVFSMPAKDAEVKVVYKKALYSVTFECDSTMATLTKKGASDDYFAFAVAANEGYEVTGVKANGIEIVPDDGLYKVNKPTGEIKVTVFAQPIPKKGWVSENNIWYFYNDDGSKATGWKLINRAWYYFKDDGAMQTGWVQDGSKWYYCGAQGPMVTSDWVEDNGAKYYFGPSGVMATGWIKENDSWYYLGLSGAMAKECWVKSGANWYYINANGLMVKGWQSVSGTWYCFDENGAMRTGWVQSKSDWYYLNPETGIRVRGWIKINGSWYYFKPENAKMATGLQEVDGKQYYFKADGSLASYEYCNGMWINSDGTCTSPAKAKWDKNDNGWFYIDSNGWYAKSCTLKIDGKNYEFDAAGYCKNP
ncbi:MAG: hypothetical protein K5779_06965 [Saccharofermentans sp.]|nr:hypothetical protein [Saccharofermentans sp.]